MPKHKENKWVDQLVKSELFRNKRICKRSRGDIQNFNAFVCVCFEGISHYFCQDFTTRNTFFDHRICSPPKRRASKVKNGFFSEALIAGLGEEEVDTLFRVFQSVRELWGLESLIWICLEKSGVQYATSNCA